MRPVAFARPVARRRSTRALGSILFKLGRIRIDLDRRDAGHARPHIWVVGRMHIASSTRVAERLSVSGGLRGPLRFLRELACKSVPAIVPQKFWEQQS